MNSGMVCATVQTVYLVLHYFEDKFTTSVLTDFDALRCSRIRYYFISSSNCYRNESVHSAGGGGYASGLPELEEFEVRLYVYFLRAGLSF